jgi:fibro-slime domain-containing protein
MKRVLWCALGIIFCFNASSMAQIYPETLWVPVTFYDFHSNKSNTEFEANYSGGRRQNMVASTLDADNKPIIGSNPYLNYYIKYWYRDWLDSAKGDYTRPLYNNGTFVRNETVTWDTTFKNKVYEDSLPFEYVGDEPGYRPGTYKFDNNREEFYPLDAGDTGFGREGLSHNYSFTMELHWKFTKVQGLKFLFTGDDDVWAYINGQRRMDIGGIHSAITDSIIVDNIPGLTNGQEYSFDFFYAERHTSNSNIQIMTNIITAQPARLSLTADATDPCAGDTNFLYATVFDSSSGVISELGDLTEWKIIRGANPSSSIFPPATGDTVRYSFRKAYDTAYIEGIVRVPQSNIVLKDTLRLYVRACHPHHLVIESSPRPAGFDTAWLRNDRPLSSLQIPSTGTSATAYAIVRDPFGNFIEESDSTRWSITRGAGTLIDSVVVGIPGLGQGIVYKKGPPGDTGEVAALSLRYPQIRKDSVRVVIDSVRYTALRIDRDTRNNPITSLSTQLGTTTRLIVEGRRSDNGAWDVIAGDWSVTGFTLSGPQSSQNWNFTPPNIGSGTITVRFSTLSTSIPVTVSAGPPAIIELYPALTGNNRYVQPPTEVVLVAGDTVPIFARIYDINRNQLMQYNTSSAPIRWSITRISGVGLSPSDTLKNRTGNQNAISITRAYNVVVVKATFEGGPIFSDSVQFRIIPGPPHHITTQFDTATILNWRDEPNVSFGPSDTSRLLYPMIRDVYNNYINKAELATWASRDILVARAEATNRIFFGEGVVTRVAVSTGTTWADVYSDNSKIPLLHDSIQVEISSITYDSLQIYILNPRAVQVDTVKIRTDSNQVLYARGKRSDGRGWDDIPVKWNISTGLEVNGTPPPLSQNWDVTPRAVDTGKIFITRQGSVSDTITAIFTPGLPNSVAIYKNLGNPALPTVQPYSLPPLSDTLTAGITYPFIAKIFDSRNAWLSRYENNVASESYFSWQISRISGETSSDTLDKKTGSYITFSPRKAYITYQMTVNFQEGTKQITASVNVYVKPGPVDHLVIEASPTPTGRARNYDTPFPNNTISFGARDTFQSAYAVLRDANQNFVSTSQNTDWQSLSDQLFTATEGITVLGEGRIRRIGETGQTDVIAWNRTNTALRDTVRVRATDFSYDSLRIVVNDSIRIVYLEMPSSEDTLLQVLGLRSFDKKWVPVFADWSYTTSSQNLTHPGQQDWLFAPGDTTSAGKITVTLGNAVPYSVGVVINPGPASKLALYPKRGPQSVLNVAYASPPTRITVIAGKNFPIVSKIFDWKEVWLKDYESAPKNALISWAMYEFPGFDSSGIFLSTRNTTAQGDSVSFFPIKAYQQVYIVGKLSENNREFLDTVLLDIVAGEPKALFIEASSNWQASPNKPNPADTIRILGNMTNMPIYAILRDTLGNFARYSTNTTWGVVNNDTAVSIWNGTTAIGEGIIGRNDSSGLAKVYGVDESGFRDSVPVVLKAYYYLKLRILVEFNPDPDSLTMPTTSDTTLRVQGLRSDTTLWEFVEDAVWEITSNLKVKPIAPVGRLWRFSPTDTGTGFIRVTQNNRVIPANDSLPDTLYVKFIPGPPSEIRVKIITPPQQRIAGQQIQMVVELYNEDGKVKGPWDFNSAVYTDILPDGGRPKPFILIGNDTVYLGNSDNEHFENGVDTVPLVLYYAPWDDDSLHQITVNLDGLKAVTEPFALIAGGLDHMKIERQERVVSPVGDTLVVRTTDDLLQLVSIGYDIYGNRRGKENSNWNSDSTLHQITGTTQNTHQIVYYLSGVEDNEYGNIIAKASSQPTISTSVFIKLLGPATKLKSATTEDVNGNGYLDRIVLKFNKPVTIPEEISEDLFRVTHGSTYFYIDSLKMGQSPTDSIVILYLKEDIGDSSAQTGWKPIISSDGNIELGLDSILDHTSIDGAGPVITSVSDKIVSATNRKQDVVTVTFSEPIQRFDNIPLKPTDMPSVMFYVWEKDPQGNFRLRDSILTGIDNIVVLNDTTISFVMSNGFTLSQWNYFSIKTIISSNGDTTSLITDKASFNGLLNPNYPNGNNVQVKVVIIGDPEHDLKIYPNPASADDRRVPAGTFTVKHDPGAHYYIEKQGGGGIIFSLTFMVPNPSDNVKVRLKIKVYDAVGNPVIYGDDDNILESDISGQSLKLSPGISNIEIYWNLFKLDSYKIAPGMYKVVEYLDYYGSPKASNYHNSRKTKLFGVSHQPPGRK